MNTTERLLKMMDDNQRTILNKHKTGPTRIAAFVMWLLQGGLLVILTLFNNPAALRIVSSVVIVLLIGWPPPPITKLILVSSLIIANYISAHKQPVEKSR